MRPRPARRRRAPLPRRGRPALRAYPAPAGAPCNDTFTVRVRPAGETWVELPAYDAVVDRAVKAHMSFVAFEADFYRAVEVEVRKNKGAFKSARIRPASAGVAPRAAGGTIAFTLARPGKFSVETDGDIHRNLLIFADPPEKDPVAGPRPDLHYFGPGLHRIGDGRGTLKLASGGTSTAVLVGDR